MLDSDLAQLYGVETKTLNRAVKRNLKRFPDDFMLQLTKEEVSNLKYHFGTSRWGGRRYAPYVFTEQGVAMLSSVLNSERAIEVNIAVMRTFVKLRELIVSNKVLATKLNQLEGKIENQSKDIQALFAAIHQLMEPPPASPKRKMGLHNH